MASEYTGSDFSFSGIEWPPIEGVHSEDDTETQSGASEARDTSQSQHSVSSISEMDHFQDHGNLRRIDEELSTTPRFSVVPTSVSYERSLPEIFGEDGFARDAIVVKDSSQKQFFTANGPQIFFSSLKSVPQQQHSFIPKPLLSKLVFTLVLAIVYWVACVVVSFQSQQSFTMIPSPAVLLCNTPFLSDYWSIWPCSSTARLTDPTLPDFPALAHAQARALQTIVDEATGMTEAGWKLWNSELAVIDLLSFLRSSDLEGKDVLEEEFQTLLTQVSSAEEELTALGAVILTAADRVIAVNTYALEVLGSLSPHWYELLFPSFGSRLAKKFHENFRWAIQVLSGSTTDIMAHCKSTASVLHAMERTLTVIHDVLTHERTITLGQRDELHAAFWTRLGGNKSHLGHLGEKLAILSGIENTHSKALKHIHRTSESVLQMQEVVSDILQGAFTASRPASRLTAQDMRSQLLDIAVSMARVVSSMADHQKKSRHTRRESQEVTRHVRPEAGFVPHV